MDFLKNNWKFLLALALLFIALLVLAVIYTPAADAHAAQLAQLNGNIGILQATIAENQRYAEVQDLLEDAGEKLDESREKLYQKFPRELREEDQIMYILYLEEKFGTEIQFSFATAQPITKLYDGTILAGVTLTVNYETTYRGFKNMANSLATDSRITSVQYATVNYDAERDLATGSFTLLVYVMETEMLEYLPPKIHVPAIGKSNLFKA